MQIVCAGSFILLSMGMQTPAVQTWILFSLVENESPRLIFHFFSVCSSTFGDDNIWKRFDFILGTMVYKLLLVPICIWTILPPHLCVHFPLPLFQDPSPTLSSPMINFLLKTSSHLLLPLELCYFPILFLHIRIYGDVVLGLSLSVIST